MPEKMDRKTKKMDKEVELAKIHIWSESILARFTTVLSTSFALFVGFLVVFWTLFSENLLPIEAFGVGVTVLTFGTVLEIYRLRSGFKARINRISDMIEMVKKGRELPELKKLVD